MKKSILSIASFIIAISSSAAISAPFGSMNDVAYAKQLWAALEGFQLVGKNATVSTPYKGTHPHGAVLDTIDSQVWMNGHKNTVIIKRNYGGKGVSKTAVANNPNQYLKAVTVMFKRTGYDSTTKDWFWVKYSPNGDILKNPKGMALAGLVGKGGNKGCIACHKAAPGGDFVFNHDRYAK